jgi:hypothetical protein
VCARGHRASSRPYQTETGTLIWVISKSQGLVWAIVVDSAVDAAGVRGPGAEQVTGGAESRGERGPLASGQLIVVRDRRLPVLRGGHRIAGELLDNGPQGDFPAAARAGDLVSCRTGPGPS